MRFSAYFLKYILRNTAVYRISMNGDEKVKPMNFSFLSLRIVQAEKVKMASFIPLPFL